MATIDKYFLKEEPIAEGVYLSPLDRCVRQIASFGGLPAISQHIQEIMSMSFNEKASLSQYANVILKNVSLTAKLLRLVNSVYFSQQSPVYSVSHAIRILGWNTICDIAASIMFLEDFGKKSATVRSLLQLSVLTANNAIVIATRCRYPRLEEAYLAGMFSVFGELLVATYLPDEYEKILAFKYTSEKDPNAAAYSVIGFTYAQLGKAMMKHWGLPERLNAGTPRLSSVSPKPETDEQWLTLIATFSHELTDKVYRSQTQTGTFPSLKQFLASYGKILEVTEENVEEILAQSFTQTEKAFTFSKLPIDKTAFTLQTAPASPEIVPPPPKSEDVPVERTTRVKKDMLRRFSDEVNSVLHSDERLELNDIVTIIMEAVYRGAGFDRVLFCLMNPARTQLQARLAVGVGADELKQKFVFPISFLEGPVGPAILKGRDVFVENVGTSRYNQSEFAGIVGACSMMMVPIRVHKRVIGCIYADRVSEILVLDQEDQALLMEMRDNLCNEMSARK